MPNRMAVHQNPLIAVIVSIGSLVFGIYLLRWAIPGLLKGEVRYRFGGYDRFKRPIHFWFAVIWGLGAGIFFFLGGLLMLYLEVMKKFI